MRAVARLAVVALVVLALEAPPASAASARAHTVKAYMTLYGWVDNSPPGPGIAHPCIHATAGGTGTAGDPVTFATDVHELPWCTVIYVPYMKRYFIHEDECSECDRDWLLLRRHRFDMWAGGDYRSLHEPERSALLACENRWTEGNGAYPYTVRVTVDPRPGLPVDSSPIFNARTNRCWSG